MCSPGKNKSKIFEAAAIFAAALFYSLFKAVNVEKQLSI